MTLVDFNRELGPELPLDDFDTIGGYVFDLFGKVPEKIEEISENGIVFRIKAIKGTIINRNNHSRCQTQASSKIHEPYLINGNRSLRRPHGAKRMCASPSSPKSRGKRISSSRGLKKRQKASERLGARHGHKCHLKREGEHRPHCGSRIFRHKIFPSHTRRPGEDNALLYLLELTERTSGFNGDGRQDVRSAGGRANGPCRRSRTVNLYPFFSRFISSGCTE
jgi:hypothetical protein